MSWFLAIQYGCWTEVYLRPCDSVVLQRQNLPATGRAVVFLFSALGFVPLPAQPWPNMVRVMKGTSEGSWGREIGTFLSTSFVQQSNCHRSPWEEAEECCPSARLPPVRPTSRTMALFSPLLLPRSSCLPDMSCRPVQAFGFLFCSQALFLPCALCWISELALGCRLSIEQPHAERGWLLATCSSDKRMGVRTKLAAWIGMMRWESRVHSAPAEACQCNCPSGNNSCQCDGLQRSSARQRKPEPLLLPHHSAAVSINLILIQGWTPRFTLASLS